MAAGCAIHQLNFTQFRQHHKFLRHSVHILRQHGRQVQNRGLHVVLCTQNLYRSSNFQIRMLFSQSRILLGRQFGLGKMDTFQFFQPDQIFCQNVKIIAAGFQNQFCCIPGRRSAAQIHLIGNITVRHYQSQLFQLCVVLTCICINSRQLGEICCQNPDILFRQSADGQCFHIAGYKISLERNIPDNLTFRQLRLDRQIVRLRNFFFPQVKNLCIFRIGRIIHKNMTADVPDCAHQTGQQQGQNDNGCY